MAKIREYIGLFVLWLISRTLVREMLKNQCSKCLPPIPLALPIIGHLAPIPHQPCWKFNKKLCMSELLGDMFTAGTDTSAITVERALSELINRPNIMQKAVHEIDSFVEESDILNLPYIQAVVKETPRLHPTGALTVRETSLALQVVQTALAAMIQCFEWRVEGGNGSVDMEEGIGIALPRANPLVCFPVARLHPIPLSSV
ncbi:hypothetical protein F511_03826 [Dorcoceras hygrometricum]|uniref:Uncharacterized protein n=1 Tax=Dorcoceras hygrometricum TaxID=472368 RepID=A0A2Z7BWF0_9LAMI|nr:hypothetical protein F511_03826 [Dorcoceras hygrometricum]